MLSKLQILVQNYKKQRVVRAVSNKEKRPQKECFGTDIIKF